MIEPIKPRAERIRELRDTKDMSMQEAVCWATREALCEAIQVSTDLFDIKRILLTIVEKKL
jgi:hypothetical protein